MKRIYDLGTLPQNESLDLNSDLFEIWNDSDSKSVKVSLAAFLSAGGLGTRWDDLRTPANVVSLVGLNDEPDWDTTYGWLLFDSDVVETIFLQFQMPHAWVAGTSLYPHVHWCKTTSATGSVKWKLSYRWMAIGEAMTPAAGNAWTVLDTNTLSVSDNNTAFWHAITSLGELTASNKSGSDILICKLERIGTDGTNDTYGADAALLYFDLHYQLNSLGSTAEFPT